jgi:hypothetical protein
MRIDEPRHQGSACSVYLEGALRPDSHVRNFPDAAGLDNDIEALFGLDTLCVPDATIAQHDQTHSEILSASDRKSEPSNFRHALSALSPVEPP